MSKNKPSNKSCSMETSGTNRNVTRYQAPDIERIRLDHEISLALASSPAAPGYNPPTWSEVKDSSVNDPFKTGLG